MAACISLVVFLILASNHVTSGVGSSHCPDVYLGNLHEGFPQYLHLVGVYRLQNQTYAKYNVYKHYTQEAYIFYTGSNTAKRTSGNWYVSPEVGNTSAAIFSISSSASSPALTFGKWKCLPKDCKSSQIKRLQCVCAGSRHYTCTSGKLNVTGLDRRSSRAVVLGEYKLSGRTYNLRPVYQQLKGPHSIFYRYGMWLVAKKFRATGGLALNPDPALRPEVTVTSWQVVTRFGFPQVASLKISCIGIPGSQPTPCSDVRCENGGVCESREQQAFCRCPDGFFGSRCEKDTRCGQPPVQSGAALYITTGQGRLSLAFYKCPPKSKKMFAVAVCDVSGTWLIRRKCNRESKRLVGKRPKV